MTNENNSVNFDIIVGWKDAGVRINKLQNVATTEKGSGVTAVS